MNPKIIEALSINGVDRLYFGYCEETGLYHWQGNSNYCGYTMEELMKRDGIIVE